MRTSDVIRKEITDLKEVIESGDELVGRHPLDLGLVISQTQLYERLKALKEELNIAVYEETKEIVKIKINKKLTFKEADYINNILFLGDEAISVNWIMRG